MTKQAKKQIGIVEGLMNEHVSMLGMPQVIVTREFCYFWLKTHGGFDPKARGFASLDWAAFGRPASALPLTDESERNQLLGMMADAMARKAA